MAARPNKRKQVKRKSASGMAQKASSRADEKSRNPETRGKSMEERARQRPGILASQADEAAGGFRKSGDFPDARSNRPGGKMHSRQSGTEARPRPGQ